MSTKFISSINNVTFLNWSSNQANFFICIAVSFFLLFTHLLRVSFDLFKGQNFKLESSKSYELRVKILDEKIFKNISIKALKCKNSEFDDNPEITAYLQVKDLKSNDNDEVFVFNGWTFSSSPTLRPFDHPVYDIWITKCY